LAKVKGTDPGGHIIREDIESTGHLLHYLPNFPHLHNQPSPADYTDTPISNILRTIGTRLTQSKQDLPHYYLTVDITMDKLWEVFNKTLVEKE
jgi:pyruvate dehydrogenase E2 component (dihydrolipoamide acetyltransferase)